MTKIRKIGMYLRFNVLRDVRSASEGTKDRMLSVVSVQFLHTLKVEKGQWSNHIIPIHLTTQRSLTLVQA
jgi:hypothetical protein